MDLINVKARVPDSISTPLITATMDSVVIGFHITNITHINSVVDVILRRGFVDTYIVKDKEIIGTEPFTPLTGKLILEEDDEVHVVSDSANTADCFISYCEIGAIGGGGGGGAGYDPRVPVIHLEEANYMLIANEDATAYRLISTTKFVPLVTEEDEGKVLVVTGDGVKWSDPLAELGVGTGLFELDDDMNIRPKERSQLYAEINLGSGHFEFTQDGDLRVKSGGDYRVGSTLPEHNEIDEGKVLKIVDGVPKWVTP